MSHAKPPSNAPQAADLIASRGSSKTTSESPRYTDGESDEFEFGGSFGAASLMIGFPLLMWYMWIGATYYDGQFPTPKFDQTWKSFALDMASLVYERAYPTPKAWTTYWVFFILEAFMFVTLDMLYYTLED
jgi:delta24(24(1))-sterol reductase